MTLAARLPVVPWDRLAPLKAQAQTFPNAPVDLSMGTPVDPVPPVVRLALSDHSDSPGYPMTAGGKELRAAATSWLRRCLDVTVPDDCVLPVIGTKEFIASLPAMLGLGPGDVVMHPALAYPTYDVGARLAGATASRWPPTPAGVDGPPTPSASGVDDPPTPSASGVDGPPTPSSGVDGSSSPWAGSAVPGVKLRWVNSPSNPTGRVMPAEELRAAVAWARAHGAVLASDECYVTLGWSAAPVSALHPSVCGSSHDGLLSVHSLSKRSSMAGYRAGFVAGDPALIAELLAIRRHAGLIVPQPVQAAMTAALDDDAHAVAQRDRYAARRTLLMDAFTAAGFRIDHSEAGLYLWAAHPGHDGWAAAELLASRCGIIVTPGETYGPDGIGHVRVALTATDERIAAAAARLRAGRLRAGTMAH